MPPANDPRFTTPASLPEKTQPAPGLQAASGATGSATATKATPAARRLNLYGELDETGPVAGSPLDGSTNLVQVSFATEGACVDPDVDRTGTLLVFASTVHRKTSDIYLKTVSGRTLTQITSDPADDVMPAFNADATKIAFASNRAGNWDIYLTGISGGPATQITSEADHELHPSWSPDGRSLAYCRFGTQSGRWEIWVTDVANPGVKRFLDYGVFPEWCPDVARSKIAFQRAKQRGSRDYSIWTIDVINDQASQATEIVSAANAALINPAWSPDGSRIAFVAVVDPLEDRARPRQSDVWVVNVDGSNRMNLTSGQFANFQPVWAGDGSVYFVSDRSGVDNLWAIRAGPPIGTNGAMQADAQPGAEKPQPSGIVNADNSGSTVSPHP
jgi:TolB protein